jgi:hypothetical protein
VRVEGGGGGDQFGSHGQPKWSPMQTALPPEVTTPLQPLAPHPSTPPHVFYARK